MCLWSVRGGGNQETQSRSARRLQRRLLHRKETARNGRKMKISLTEEAQPFTLTVQKQIPFTYREMVKDELDKQVAAGVIQPVTKATDWVQPLVVVS